MHQRQRLLLQPPSPPFKTVLSPFRILFVDNLSLNFWLLADGSDTDTIPEAEELSHYQPISADDDNDRSNSDEEHHHLSERLSPLPNGHRSCDGSSEDDEKEEGAESAIWRAFREDEERRSAPITREDSVRVVEAMRRISFAGSPLDWAGLVPERQWMDRLRRQAGTSTSPQP